MRTSAAHPWVSDIRVRNASWSSSQLWPSHSRAASSVDNARSGALHRVSLECSSSRCHRIGGSKRAHSTVVTVDGACCRKYSSPASASGSVIRCASSMTSTVGAELSASAAMTDSASPTPAAGCPVPGPESPRSARSPAHGEAWSRTVIQAIRVSRCARCAAQSATATVLPIPTAPQISSTPPLPPPTTESSTACNRGRDTGVKGNTGICDRARARETERPVRSNVGEVVTVPPEDVVRNSTSTHSLGRSLPE